MCLAMGLFVGGTLITNMSIFINLHVPSRLHIQHSLMKPYFKGKQLVQPPHSYSRNLIPSCTVKYSVKHSILTVEKISDLWHHSSLHVSCTMVFKVCGVVPFVWYNGIPQALPSQHHFTTLWVQYSHTLENHSTTTTYQSEHTMEIANTISLTLY